jgi:hypothetical protein
MIDALLDLLRRFGLNRVNRDEFWSEMRRNGWTQADIDRLAYQETMRPRPVQAPPMGDYEFGAFLADGGIGLSDLTKNFSEGVLRVPEQFRGYRETRARAGWPMNADEEAWMRKHYPETAAAVGIPGERDRP